MDPVTVLDFDADGAVEETAARAGISRSSLLRRAAVGGGALIGSGAILGGLPALAQAAGVAQSDVDILNFALTLEYLEAAFYREAVQKGHLVGYTKKFAHTVAMHEQAHVDYLRKALGAAAVKQPRFDFKGTNHHQRSFQQTAMTLEDVGVSAYAGQGPLIKDKGIVAAALSVHSVEARHAAWIRDIIGRSKQPLPAPNTFDKPRTKSEVLALVKGTGFIVG